VEIFLLRKKKKMKDYRFFLRFVLQSTSPFKRTHKFDSGLTTGKGDGIIFLKELLACV